MRRRIVISGRVQGVGFRWSAATKAERLGVSGSIRNLDEGSVEAVVDGEAEAVYGLTKWIRVGPPGARVDDLVVEDLSDGGSTLNQFRII